MAASASLGVSFVGVFARRPLLVGDGVPWAKQRETSHGPCTRNLAS